MIYPNNLRPHDRSVTPEFGRMTLKCGPIHIEIMIKTCDQFCDSKSCLKRQLKKKTKTCFFKTAYRLMQVKSIAECSKGSILQCFRPSLSCVSFVIKIFVLSMIEWPPKTGFPVNAVTHIYLL